MDNTILTSKDLVKQILKKRKYAVILKVVVSIILRSLLLTIPVLYSMAINTITKNNINLAIIYFVIALGITILYYLFNQFNEYAYYNLYNKMYNDFAWEIVKTTQYNSAYSLSRFSLGEYSNMLHTDINIIVDFLDSSIIRLVRACEFIIIYGYFFTLNKFVFTLSIFIAILSMFIEFIRSPKVEKYSLNRKSQLDNYISTINDTFLGMSEIKGLHILDKVKSRIDLSNQEYLKENKKYNIYYQGGKFLILGIIEVVRYILLIYGAYLIATGEFQIGAITLIYDYYAKIVENFGEICILGSEFSNFKVSLKRVNKVFEHSNTKNDYKITELNTQVGQIEFKDILYGDRKDPILKKVSLQIEPNSITIITGKIGSGKSGIFDLLMRINHQHQGTITINNIDINDIEDNLYYNLVSLVRKTPTFFEMSIMDNLKLVLDNENRIKEVCIYLGLDKEINKLTNGYNTIINSKEVNTELRQMLGIARIFIKDTPIMLFDEIIDTLDDDNKEKILTILKEYKINHTIVIISRASDMLDFGDRLITMERNTIKSIKDKKVS